MKIKTIITYTYSRPLGVFLTIILFSSILCLPQLITGGTIIGSDALFHYNRIYESAMQIKNSNYSYFISIYGFQQSGRIVNALYGPFFAYFQGLLLLISGTWFKYQILSRVLIGTIAGSGMFLLLNKSGSKKNLSLILSLFYLTTFAIQYWTNRQGFSSWGAAFFPFSLLPAISYIKDKKLNVLPLALAVSLLFQVHVLSTIFLVLAYIPLFLVGFITSKEKLKDFGKISIAILIFFVLSLNVILPLVQVSLNNTLIQPFANKKLPLSTLTHASYPLLFQPAFLIIFLIFVLFFGFYWKLKKNLFENTIFITFLCFLFLSSSYLFWKFALTINSSIANIIQFPFRFFIPTTVFTLLLTGLYLSREKKHQKLIVWTCFFLTGVSAIQVCSETSVLLSKHYLAGHPVQPRLHTMVYGDPQEIRESVHSNNLKTLLDLTGKSTPDYLPLYQKTSLNKYNLYQRLIIDNNDKYTKTIENGQLTLTWTADQDAQVNLPIILYKNSLIRLNGQNLSKSQYDLSYIGTPIVKQRAGENKLVVTYQQPLTITVAITTSALSWIIIPLIALRRYRHY